MKIQIFQYIIDAIRKKIPKPEVEFLVFWVGTKCSLKCKMCGNLIPYMHQTSYNAKEIIDDIRFISENTIIKLLQIQGGEPFTHPDFDKIIYAISKMNIEKIEIATNATIMPSQKVIRALQDSPNVLTRISNYDCSVKLREKFCEILDNNGINYSFYDFMYKDGSWHSNGGICEEKNTNTDEVIKMYETCKSKYCTTLCSGSLSTCGKIPAINELYSDSNFKNSDELNVRKLRKSLLGFKHYKIRKAIIDFLKNKIVYKEQCRYCNISNERFPAAIQLTPKEFEEAKEVILKRKANLHKVNQ